MVDCIVHAVKGYFYLKNNFLGGLLVVWSSPSEDPQNNTGKAQPLEGK